MNLIINISSIYKGGAEQVAVSFVNECKFFPEHTYHVFLRDNIEKQLDCSSFPDNFTFYKVA
ncbi:MAG: mannosyltransferase, partial [Flavobacterium sp.]|nr:mannosyltransferase [Flavobacterium sp.]